jgi:hypothetical protein
MPALFDEQAPERNYSTRGSAETSLWLHGSHSPAKPPNGCSSGDFFL